MTRSTMCEARASSSICSILWHNWSRRSERLNIQNRSWNSCHVAACLPGGRSPSGSNGGIMPFCLLVPQPVSPSMSHLRKHIIPATPSSGKRLGRRCKVFGSNVHTPDANESRRTRNRRTVTQMSPHQLQRLTKQRYELQQRMSKKYDIVGVSWF
jgi:hypothetical protein